MAPEWVAPTNKRKQLNASLKDYVTKLLIKDCTGNKKHDNNEEENSPEWATPTTKTKENAKVVNETAPAMKKYSTTESNNETTESKTKNVIT
ncbi:32377_t:CDS:2 [Gigaspora margarita]|uniref:32377_t:CDS:1 n=1 Tax=Gigaspora margarita TaxID=4874 RepID=A0ABN7VHS0_GIGMA|nr:32377_t:CDS:2 [Gigaspora margarita]